MKKIKSLLVMASILTCLNVGANDAQSAGSLLSFINLTVTRVYVPLSHFNVGSTHFAWDWVIFLRQDALNFLAGDEPTQRLETLFGELKQHPELLESSKEELSSLVLSATENL